MKNYVTWSELLDFGEFLVGFALLLYTVLS